MSTSLDYTKDDIVGYECKHVSYTKGEPRDRGEMPDDFHLIKEVIHLKDGRRIPNLRKKINYHRPFWITKPHFRNHKEKKEFEYLDKLTKYESTQAGLVNAIKRALDVRGPQFTLRQVSESPYLYGSDITSTAIIKRQYMDKWPTCRSENTVAVLDIETDVVHGTEEPILVALTFKDKAILCATEMYTQKEKDWAIKMREYAYKRLDKTFKARNIDLIVEVTKDPLEAIKKVIAKAHEWRPDFVSVWNMDFDIPKILKTIEQYGGDANEIFSDPMVPKPFRKVRYKHGNAVKVMASGKSMPLPPYDRWHTLFCPASFYVIDQMCVFRKLRVAKGQEPNYKLDTILKKYANCGKLTNPRADKYTGLKWHVYMQTHEKLEYGAYNLFDCIGCEILDEQMDVGDLRLSMSIQAEHSDYDKFPSQPRRTVDDLHFKWLSMGKVIASTPPKISTEFDLITVSTSNWITTLPAHLVIDNGIPILSDVPTQKSLIRVATYDLDVEAAYPNGESVMNAAKHTTVAELVTIEGIDENTRRAIGLNLTGGVTNAVEIMCSVCKAPTIEQLINDFMKNGIAA